MSEDVKPKLNIQIVHEGQSITIKVRPDMKFQKIFNAAEQQFGKEKGTFKFRYEDKRLDPEDTPAGLDMEDGDQIDAVLEQVGGC